MERDTYTWSAVYEDGSVVGEYDSEEGRGFAEVDGTRVNVLDIEPLIETLPAHRVFIPDGATPVFFRRRSIAINVAQEGARQSTTAHCLGWKRGELAVYLFVFDDGSVLLTDDLQAV